MTRSKSLIITVLNEDKTIDSLISSIITQTQYPDELVIVDGGSKDKTITLIKRREKELKAKGILVKLLSKKGNRSVGRNEAIKNSKGETILCTDAGCILKENWIEEISEPFTNKGSFDNKDVDVVAGYYKGIASNTFQKSLIPYVLVMEDKINPVDFLPSSRSMAFTKEIWMRAGGFSEELSHNEDYAFAIKLKEIGAKRVFHKDAIVYWLPRNTMSEAFIMFYRFAYGDAEAGILRLKVTLIFLRYFLGLLFFLSYFVYKNPFIFKALILFSLLYLFWAIVKNYRYVRELQAFYYLPLLQLISDLAVILGTIRGLFNHKN